MVFPIKASFAFFIALCVMTIVLLPRPALSKDTGKIDQNEEKAEKRALQKQVQVQIKQLQQKNLQLFLQTYKASMQLQAWKIQYASLWKFKGTLDEVNVQTFAHSPKLEINKPQVSIYSPTDFSKGQNWLTATTKIDKDGKMIHTEETIRNLVESGALTLDKDGKSFLLHSYYSVCKECAPHVCAMFEYLKKYGVEEGLVTFEQLFNKGKDFETSLEILKKCGLEMVQFK